MPVFIEAPFRMMNLEQYRGAGTDYVVQTPSGVIYIVYIDVLSDVVFIKSSDGGLTWSVPVVVFAGTTVALSIWYDRWSSIAAGLIHCAYIESVGHDVLYRSINTESADALGTQTTIFAGVSVANGKALSITRARGGNLGCIFNIDAGTEDGFSKSTDVGAIWAAGGDPTEGASGELWALLPGWAADNQDLMCFFWDASASEISRKLFDDSANTWAETSIATSMTARSALSDFPSFAAAVDITNSRNLLVAWSNVDSANADLRCWHVTESAITEVTNVVLNSTDDQVGAAIGIDIATGHWYVFYCGKSDGSETVATALNIYYKISKDSGTTWGAETALTSRLTQTNWLMCIPRMYTTTPVVARFTNVEGNGMMDISARIARPRATCVLGMI